MRTNLRGPALAASAFLLLTLSAAAVSAQVKTRAFRHAFPAAENAELRLANLAGRVELVPATGNQVVVEANVHADANTGAETQKLLQEMKWVRSTDRSGNPEWALSYPVERYKGFTYPRPGQQDDDLPGFVDFFLNLGGGSQTQTTYRGERIRIYAEERSSAPVLYANLRIALPAGSHVVVRNVVGAVNGQGNLEGMLTVDTGSGNVRLASYSGNLTIDTGSGNVVVGSARGETLIDTGSGDVVVRKLVGNGMVDTGSGNVTIESVSAGRLGIDTGSGDVTVRNGNAAKLLADTGSGNVQVLQVEVQELQADTGSGDVTVNSSLAQARRVQADTGSGTVRILAGPDASFDVESDQGSGELKVGYADAELRKSGRKVVGARRGNGQTVIRVETGSGDCVISPRG